MNRCVVTLLIAFSSNPVTHPFTRNPHIKTSESELNEGHPLLIFGLVKMAILRNICLFHEQIADKKLYLQHISIIVTYSI